MENNKPPLWLRAIRIIMIPFFMIGVVIIWCSLRLTYGADIADKAVEAVSNSIEV